MIILTGDIGGTKTRIALLQHHDGRPQLLRETTYASQEHASLSAILADFLSTLDTHPEAAGFAVAGPIAGRRCNVTNLPWQIDADQLEGEFSISRVILLNDLEATAWGIGMLTDKDLTILQQGVIGAQGNRTVIAAGTGLGQAGLYWNGERHTPFASEGGHCDFAPQNELEFELSRHLGRQYEHVSWERVVSGPGLVAIHRFLCELHGIQEKDNPAGKVMSGGRAAAIVASADRADPICIETMELFVRLYGAETGNQALKHMAIGGVYIGGGIAPKIIHWLKRPGFIQAFRDKGQMRGLMEKMTVKVIMNERTALYGPAIRLCSI